MARWIAILTMLTLSAANTLLDDVAFAQSSSTSVQAVVPFDASRWRTYYGGGRRYFQCEPPRCAPRTLVSFAIEAVKGDLRAAFEVEVGRWQGSTADRQLLEGKKILTFTVAGEREPFVLNAMWRFVPPGNSAFGALRIAYVAGTKILILSTSEQRESSQASEAAVSRSLGLIP